VNPRAGLDDVKKRKFLTLLGLERLPLGRPARSQSLYRLRYPGSCHNLKIGSKIFYKNLYNYFILKKKGGDSSAMVSTIEVAVAFRCLTLENLHFAMQRIYNTTILVYMLYVSLQRQRHLKEHELVLHRC
jgi:hypothetical protein